MKKRNQGKTLSRNTTQRTALKRTMLVSLVNFGSIKTTLAKAKALKPFAERMITRAKRAESKENLVVVTRRLKKDLPLDTAKKIIEIAAGYKNREGGYLRIVKLVPRESDSAEMAVIEWVDWKADKSNTDSEKTEVTEKESVKKKTTTTKVVKKEKTEETPAVKSKQKGKTKSVKNS